MLRHTEPSSGITSTPRSSDVMQYTVRHLTRFTYDNPISESVMEVRMQPRTEQHQRCLGFELTTTPRATVTAYRDPLSNIVHHFDIPGRHGQLTIVAEAIVEFVGAPNLPAALPVEAWAQVEAIERSQSHWEFLQAEPVHARDAAAEGVRCDAGDRRPPRPAVGDAGHQRSDPPPLHLPPAGHRRRLADRSRARERRRRLPGLRARHAGVRAAARHPRPLRQRLPVPRLRRHARPTAPPTPGSRRSCPASAGSASTRPTTSSPARATSASRSAATTPTCRRPRASSAAARPTSWRSPSRCRRPTRPCSRAS